NLQHGGNILVWFSPNWSLELTQQFNARLHRQGQTKPVFIHTIVARGTVDHVILGSLTGKFKTQDELLRALKAE
ncbi:MAG: ATP-dependent helicase, partial [Candidatus Pacearchaeota archaeon]|nr:ATP-dependent helicase [Candidatus Pacearchaeota archaeon]